MYEIIAAQMTALVLRNSKQKRKNIDFELADVAIWKV
jgi:hypothetical protein